MCPWYSRTGRRGSGGSAWLVRGWVRGGPARGKVAAWQGEGRGRGGGGWGAAVGEGRVVGGLWVGGFVGVWVGSRVSRGSGVGPAVAAAAATAVRGGACSPRRRPGAHKVQGGAAAGCCAAVDCAAM